MRLDRVLHSSVVYPADYGLIPRTLYHDGERETISRLLSLKSAAYEMRDAVRNEDFHYI